MTRSYVFAARALRDGVRAEDFVGESQAVFGDACLALAFNRVGSGLGVQLLVQFVGRVVLALVERGVSVVTQV